MPRGDGAGLGKVEVEVWVRVGDEENVTAVPIPQS